MDWENIDPYSGLEENTDTQDSPQTQSDTKDPANRQPQQTTESNSSIIGTVYFMRERKTVRHSTKPLRLNRNLVNYSQMDHSTDSNSPKRPKRKPAVPSESSAARIFAQQIISNTPAPLHLLFPATKKRFNRKDPSKAKPVHRNSNNKQEDYMEADTEDASDPSRTDSQTCSSPLTNKFNQPKT